MYEIFSPPRWRKKLIARESGSGPKINIIAIELAGENTTPTVLNGPERFLNTTKKNGNTAMDNEMQKAIGEKTSQRFGAAENRAMPDSAKISRYVPWMFGVLPQPCSMCIS